MNSDNDAAREAGHELDKYSGDRIENEYKYKLNFEEWWKFREKVRAGIDVDRLRMKDGTAVGNENKYKYSAFGRANYIVYLSLASAYENISRINKLDPRDVLQYFLFNKLVAETYYHYGVAIDNIARIILILFGDKHASVKEVNEVDYGKFISGRYSHIKVIGAVRLENEKIKEVIQTRNNLTHYWKTSASVKSSDVFWPEILREKKGGVFWWYRGKNRLETLNDKFEDLGRDAHNLNVRKMIDDDFRIVLEFLSSIYKSSFDQVDQWLEKNGLVLQ